MIFRKKKNKQAAWEKNIKKLKNGKFGELGTALKCFETLARYWKAQAEADYPLAVENMLYFENLLREIEMKGDADKPKVTCLNCKHFMFSDMYGECNKQLRIVNPSDTCEYAESKERGADK